ncbi:MAG: hypothetical protein IPM12_04845 [Flavobacteriales bacterium]|nr:hypothetical protein [Flavobacteriales bacterium]
MTYYNILFGLLFIGAFREVLHSLGTSNFWAALLILSIVVNDMINVTDQFEQRGHGPMYSVWMKLIDLICFMAVALALICLDPEESFMKMDVVRKIPWHDRPWLPWALLTLYWSLAVAWNALSKEYSFKRNGDRYDLWIQIWSILFIVPFLFNTIWVAVYGPAPLTTKYVACGTLLALGAYVVYFKPKWWKTGKQAPVPHTACGYSPPTLPTFSCSAPQLAERLDAMEKALERLTTKPTAEGTGGGQG